MQKNILYVVIVILVVWVGYLLMRQPVSAPETVPEPEDSTEAMAATTTSDTAAEMADTVTFTGTFVSLVEGQSHDARVDRSQLFYYLLVDDGTEIVRVDLRPLFGYSTTDIIGKLGVERGDRVQVSGRMGTDGFVVSTVTPAE